jgi:hypothetical protein
MDIMDGLQEVSSTGNRSAHWNEQEEQFSVVVPMKDRPENITFDFAVRIGQLIELFDSKQKDYGKGNMTDFGRMGILVRLTDKFARIKKLTQNGRLIAPDLTEMEKGAMEVRNEPLRDTYMDIAVYTIIDWLLEDGKW